MRSKSKYIYISLASVVLVVSILFTKYIASCIAYKVVIYI